MRTKIQTQVARLNLLGNAAIVGLLALTFILAVKPF